MARKIRRPHQPVGPELPKQFGVPRPDYGLRKILTVVSVANVPGPMQEIFLF